MRDVVLDILITALFHGFLKSSMHPNQMLRYGLGLLRHLLHSW